MRVLVDENIPRMTVDRVRELGHDVKAADEGLADVGLWDVALPACYHNRQGLHGVPCRQPYLVLVNCVSAKCRRDAPG